MRETVTQVGAPTVARSAEEERRRRKQRLAATLRLFAQYGFDEGAGGHVTARDPVDLDCFWVNPFGMYFGAIRASDLLLVSADGRILVGQGRVNPAGFAIHAAVHAARPDVVAAAHTHSIHGRTWSALGRTLDPITQDACAFFDDHSVHTYYGGVALTEGEGQRIATSLGQGKAVILQNHGLLTVGGSVQEAAWWYIAMERCCQVQLMAEAAGPTRGIDSGVAKQTRDMIGTPEIARLNFRVIYDEMVRTQPDVLE